MRPIVFSWEETIDDGRLVCWSTFDVKKAISSQLTLFCLIKQAATIDPVISLTLITGWSSDKPFRLVRWVWCDNSFWRSSFEDEPGGESTSANVQFQTNVKVDEAEFVVPVGDGVGMFDKWSLLFEQQDLRRYFNTSDNCRQIDNRRSGDTSGGWDPADAVPSVDIVIQMNVNQWC